MKQLQKIRGVNREKNIKINIFCHFSFIILAEKNSKRKVPATFSFTAMINKAVKNYDARGGENENDFTLFFN